MHTQHPAAINTGILNMDESTAVNSTQQMQYFLCLSYNAQLFEEIISPFSKMNVCTYQLFFKIYSFSTIKQAWG